MIIQTKLRDFKEEVHPRKIIEIEVEMTEETEGHVGAWSEK